MPATEHAPLPRALPSLSPRDQPSSPRISVPEPPLPLQPSSLTVESEQLKPEKSKETVTETETPKKPAPEPTDADKAVDIEPPSELKAQESSADKDEADDEDEPSELELINMDTFSQIVELDEDEESHDFSQPMVWDYFQQAEVTFKKMDEAHEKKNLRELSELGHFLKGSSAALGLARVQDSCEKIQHYGQLRDEVANRDLKPAEALEMTSKLLKRVKKEYFEAQIWLKDFFGTDL